MEYSRCQSPCACFIASDNPHSKCVKCMDFSHAREAVYGVSKCTFCEILRLKTLCSRLEVFERESSVFLCRAPEPSATFCESATWGFGCGAQGNGERADLDDWDDWLILAHSRELVSCHRDIILRHIHALGLRTNTKKSVLSPSWQTVFLFICRPVWLLPGFPVSTHVWPASN